MCILAAPLRMTIAAEATAAEGNPKSPLGPGLAERADARPGRIELSDGRTVRGVVWMTRGKGLEIFEDAKNLWHEVGFSEVARVENAVEEEKTVREWRFKEGGNDEKVFTGRTCVDRRYSTVVTKADGTVIKGHVKGTVIHVETAGGRHKYFLRQYHRGEWSAEPSDLVYVKAVILDAGPAEGRSPPDSRPGTRQEGADSRAPEGGSGPSAAAGPRNRDVPRPAGEDTSGTDAGKASGAAAGDRSEPHPEGKRETGRDNKTPSRNFPPGGADR
ncbi:MAG: hypothetical protein N3A38_06680 [Planctomycetota bacterium]|nr:hypothetical protein [Planctomycetota bacterium]